MLSLDHLNVVFNLGTRRAPVPLKAVRDVTLNLEKGDCLGLVGESGSGKSTIGRTILGLNRIETGRITFEGVDIGNLNRKSEMQLRQSAQMIFQDPHSSLNPRMTIFRSVAEPLVLHTSMRGAELRERVQELLNTVGLETQFLYRYPHELSGGQKQRVCIARAIALNPKLLVLDEPTSALDVSVQAQILEFLKGLQQRLGLTYLFISHNLAVVRHMCNKTAVLYLGRVIEEGPTEELFQKPLHPYTRALIDAVPLPKSGQDKRSKLIRGEIPSPIDLPPGCAFYGRCPHALDGVCNLTEIGHFSAGADRYVSCVLQDPQRSAALS
ncbi:MAG: ABC transporter ATP-binding protein [Roseibium sp.]|uniref:ABC transporter ATP-binding protein n=1 Tax=Roseibium sp. TaxID=1936156 RepID=UPI00261A0882|nr:ABC transporter ATP-binding protein [Roseibium sp.]MCV0426616.1 ABC transporter ATP-binding protein [Roseibium sp.]